LNLIDIDFSPEFTFKTSRSGGSGGQNVNKVSTKVELDFNIASSLLLTDDQKNVLFKKLESKINKEGILRIVSQTERSQLGNKEKTVRKFYELLTKAFKPVKKRLKTKPGKAAKEKRIKTKNMISEKKRERRISY
jgi:ribosome-associated protein